MKTMIAAFTAIVIAATATVGTVQAAPLNIATTQYVQTADESLTNVGYKHRRRRRAAAATGVAVGLGVLALGAALASQPQRRCYVETYEVWSERRQAWVIKERRVC